MRGIIQRDPPVRDRGYLNRVRELPCISCGVPGPSVAHHISGRARGMAQKISDHDTVPLCVPCHGFIHSSTSYGEAMRKRQESWLMEIREELA